MTRLRLFLQLVCRPHPYAYPGSMWDAWTKHFVWPREAWEIAGVLADCPAYQEPAHDRDALPVGHVVLEQAEMMDGRVSQTVRHQNGTEYQRIVSAEEAFGEEDND